MSIINNFFIFVSNVFIPHPNQTSEIGRLPIGTIPWERTTTTMHTIVDSDTLGQLIMAGNSSWFYISHVDSCVRIYKLCGIFDIPRWYKDLHTTDLSNTAHSHWDVHQQHLLVCLAIKCTQVWCGVTRALKRTSIESLHLHTLWVPSQHAMVDCSDATQQWQVKYWNFNQCRCMKLNACRLNTLSNSWRNFINRSMNVKTIFDREMIINNTCSFYDCCAPFILNPMLGLWSFTLHPNQTTNNFSTQMPNRSTNHHASLHRKRWFSPEIRSFGSFAHHNGHWVVRIIHPIHLLEWKIHYTSIKFKQCSSYSINQRHSLFQLLFVALR